ncbi:MAG: tRNA epoxyqueuosine(34) reductase QueG [Cytophagaceae bacterium BCCC1]|nr:MAG: tRNA epoxyqueuosine(34) reductase QueG [Cytophagaceae bacterium BCCC1]
MSLQKDKNTAFIKSKALELGFDFCGISKADFLEDEAKLLEIWLNKNYNGKMAYMANYFDKRLDPRLLVEGAKSVITFILNYYPEKELTEQEYKISKYAYGTDYHFVIKDKLSTLLTEMQVEIGNINARVFVDSAPVMDKVWAKKGGLGWIGKHSNLINRKIGSFFFIGEIICDLELNHDGPIKDYCGTCTACIDACPTDAISEPYVVNGSKCISYLTIELKENIPTEFKDKMENWAFGCDICQDVCPWNSFAKPHNTPEFLPNEDLKNLKNWEEITQEVFSKTFKNSAIKRTKYEGLMRNIDFLKKNS